jgi:hypothetical protein
MQDIDVISGRVLDVALRLHRQLGPGLLINFGGKTLRERRATANQ